MTHEQSAPAASRHLRSIGDGERNDTTQAPQADPVVAVAGAIAQLHRSAEPADVLSSFARQCVPAFSDACVIDVVEADRPGYRIEYPVGGSGLADPHGHGQSAGRARQICNALESDPIDPDPAYFGAVIHTWREHVPTAADRALARLMLDRAVATITRERIAHAHDRAAADATHLRIALSSSRRIGAAIGIIMYERKVTESAAFDLLREASQVQNRKLRDVADDVVFSGTLSVTR